jgi:hypothetical protein
MESSTEKNLEKVSEKPPVSVYSVSFTEIITDAEREFLIERSKAKKNQNPDNKSLFSKAVFKWRNAVAIAAILAVGVLHFAYQLSVIKTESTQVAEFPVKTEQVSKQTAETKSIEFEAKKADVVNLEKPVPTIIKQRQTEVAPSKPQYKKKVTVETKSARLRRAEKLLTGI